MLFSEDVILDQKRMLELMTNVSDETKQQALNLLDDYVPTAPPGSPPYSPTSPEYSPVVQCNPRQLWTTQIGYLAETIYNTETSGDGNNDEPLVE